MSLDQGEIDLFFPSKAHRWQITGLSPSGRVIIPWFDAGENLPHLGLLAGLIEQRCKGIPVGSRVFAERWTAHMCRLCSGSGEGVRSGCCDKCDGHGSVWSREVALFIKRQEGLWEEPRFESLETPS